MPPPPLPPPPPPHYHPPPAIIINNNNNNDDDSFKNNHRSSDGGGAASSSPISPGLTSGLRGSAATLGTPRGSGFGSAFRFQSHASPAGASGYNMSSMMMMSPGSSGGGGGANNNLNNLTPPGGGPPPGVSGGGAESSTPGSMNTMPGTPLTARGDRRSKMVRERSRSSAAFASSSTTTATIQEKPPMMPTASAAAAAAAAAVSNTIPTMKHIAEEEGEVERGGGEEERNLLPALFTSFCYKGTEVIFAAINGSPSSAEGNRTSSSCHLLGIHARTRCPFQKCYIDDDDDATASRAQTSSTKSYNSNSNSNRNVEIVQLTSHPSTGIVYAATNRGDVHSFCPSRSDPMKEAYGKFRWAHGSVARGREVFGYPAPTGGASAAAASSNSAGGSNVGAGRGPSPRRSPRHGPRMSPRRSTDFAKKKESSRVMPALSMEITDDGFEVEVEEGSMTDGPGGKQVGSDTFSLDNRTASLSMDRNDNDKEEEATTMPCFHRRKQRHKRFAASPRRASSAGSSSHNALPNNYPLTDGQPPLPEDGNNDNGDDDGYGVMICASMTEKRVLVVHKDQLAVFDFSLPPVAASATAATAVTSAATALNEASSMATVPARSPPPPPPHEALLLWTHKLQGAVVDHASLSGDGCAIAVALRGEGMGVPYPFGVRTYVRDGDDGSGPMPAGGGKAAGGANEGMRGKPPVHRHKRTGSGMQTLPAHQSPPLPKTKQHNLDGLLENVFGHNDGGGSQPPALANDDKGQTTAAATAAAKQGILYKPAQFLVHSAPVTRLAFRGYGTTTSSAFHNNQTNRNASSNQNDPEGNDLLLTTCHNDNSVRIFSQNSWRQLMHWKSPPKSRADWVRGISAANLGDLDDCPGSGERRSKKKDGQLTPIPKDIDSSNHSNSSHNNQHNSHPQHSDAASVNSDGTSQGGGINRALLSPKNHHAPPKSPFPSASTPGTHAGAWIAELTFRNAFPALRLSRLSYMKTGGDDALPAHFESVAAILPPGSLAEETVLQEESWEGGLSMLEGGCGECRLEVEGIWPVWDPWEPDVRGGRGGGAKDVGKDAAQSNNNNTLSSPLAGSTASTMAPRWLGDGADLGGSHMPPSELRITSRSASGVTTSNINCLTQIEMPLWGDKDFGAMEFGNPMRYVMMLPDADDGRTAGTKTIDGSDGDGGGERRVMVAPPAANLAYESGSRLCATSSNDGRSVNLVWRRHGAVNLKEILSTENGYSNPFEEEKSTIDRDIRRFQDLSLIPLPLSLPSLTLPRHNIHHHTQHANINNSTSTAETISSLHWWPDENYGGPPRLVTLTCAGTLVVYEMPPPWSALEPPMPGYDPFDDDEVSRGSSVDSDFGEGGSFDDAADVISAALDEHPDDHAMMEEVHSFDNSAHSRGVPKEYEINIAPHPDFGLGLRLEAQVSGMPAVAGSFKKHPLSGGRLPAERSGVIALGDELLAVNDVGLEGMRFEDAIGMVRQIGFDSKGGVLKMRFRRCRRKRSTLASASLGSGSRSLMRQRSCASGEDSKGSSGGNGAANVTVKVVAEDGLIGLGAVGSGVEGNNGSGGSLATVEVGADAENQQGFGRVIAIVRDAIPASDTRDNHDVHHPQQSSNNSTTNNPTAMLLLPWNFGKGAVVSSEMYGGALILWAVPTGNGDGRRAIKAARLEAILDMDPKHARFEELGSICLDDGEGNNDGESTSAVKSISFISSTEKGWLVAVHDCNEMLPSQS